MPEAGYGLPIRFPVHFINPVMRQFFLSIAFVCTVLVMQTSCIKDGEDLDDCAQYIQFVYDYNMDFVDLFYKQASKINVFVYDSEGNYVTTLQDQQNEFPESYRMQIPKSLTDGEYQFVVWSGLYEDSYNASATEAKRSNINSLHVEVKNYADGTINFEMKPLFYGSQNITVNHRLKGNYPIYLKKDTKKFRIVMQDLSDSSKIDVNDYTFEIKSANGLYDHLNNPSGNTLTYTPYYTYNDANAGAVAELNTLRLISKANNRFKITNKKTGATIVDFDLDKYLAALKLQAYNKMSYQEYLDREDSFSFILLFNNINQEGNNIGLSIKINGWLIREQNGDL